MKTRLFVIILLLILSSACVEIQTFPDNGSPAIYEVKQFVSLSDHPEQPFKGQSIRIAGRMVGMEKQDQGCSHYCRVAEVPKKP